MGPLFRGTFMDLRNALDYGIIYVMKLFIATHNAHKVREISQILPEDFEVIADDPQGVDENAPTFAGNALIKVRAIAARHPGAWCMADDSGLEVVALHGAPGVHSARYAGEECSTPANNALLLKNLTGVQDRRANFTCAIALIDPNGREHLALGRCYGHIAEAPSGAAGFGYDPLFIPDGETRSFGELSAAEKNAISHRAKALEQAREICRGTPCTVKGIVFDFGGVMTTSVMPDRLKPVMASLGIPWDVLVRGFKKYRNLHDGGFLTLAEMYEKIWADEGITVSTTDLHRIVEVDRSSWLYRNERTLEWMKTLRAQGYRIGILTNMSNEFAPLFRKYFGDYIAQASSLVISGEEKLYKPQREIYDLAQSRMELPAANLVFIDDTQTNIDAAKNVGWHGIRFESIDQATRDFASLS